MQEIVKARERKLARYTKKKFLSGIFLYDIYLLLSLFYPYRFFLSDRNKLRIDMEDFGCIISFSIFFCMSVCMNLVYQF